MKALILREIKSFFGSPIGYLVVAIFLIINGLFLWVFEGEYNILNSGFADLTPFFTLSPLVFIFLIPAVTMRSFSDEKKQGTIELLLTKPISIWQIVGGKFWGALALIVIAIIPTFIYVYAISSLGMPEGNIDFGSTMGSYFGLLFLIAGYTSIGIYTSTLSENQIVAFILAVFLCFLFYFGFEGFAILLPSFENVISSLGMQNHFKSMSRGVIDTRDVIYFVSITTFFLSLTVYNLKSFQTFSKQNSLKKLGFSLLVLIVTNVVSGYFFHRFDLTKDKRYTLSSTSLQILKDVKEPLAVKVYLQGDLPADFVRLQNETRDILEEFQAYNKNIVFEFVNPLEDEDKSMDNAKKLFVKGLTPINITVDDKGKQSQAMVFPWAVATYNNKEVNIPLLKNIMGASTTQKVIGSVQHLEYAVADALNKITKEKQKKIAVIKGNGELEDIQIAKFLLQTRESYHIGPFTLDSVAKKPVETLAALQKYDLAIIAKPTEIFTDAEKQVLDQFVINGGKSLWLIDQTSIEMDSLYNQAGASLAFPRDLNLNDLFFKYGIRIYPDLVKDEHGSPIKLASGEQGSQTHYETFNWKFAPQIYSESNHPIVKNLGGIKFDFANAIDTLKNGIKKTILLKSSPYSKRIGTPTEINLNMVTEQTSPAEYVNKGNIPVSVLLEGAFHSMFENRVLPFDQKTFLPKGKNNKMIVISDGDLIKNQLDKNGQPAELGYDQRSGNLYDNKDLMMNCVNYLLDDNGLINIRSKEFDVPLLDKEKVYENYTFTQWLTIGLPIVILTVFGFVFTYFRKRKYSK